MNCPGCNHSDWEYPDVAIARCKNCGYLLNPYVVGMKRESSSSNLNRSENSKRWAIIVSLVPIISFVLSIWIPDWFAIGMMGAAVSLFLWVDSLLYS